MGADGMNTGEAGAERRSRAQGAKADKLQDALVALDPVLGRWANEYVFGEVWADDALSFEERMLVAITALAAQNRRNQLRNYLHGALQDGIPAAKLREVMKMMTVYAGFPVAIEAMSELDAVLKAHEGRR
jgi:4-carboxymuconolactone decarboxylase